jgi:hypothetical protein
VDDLELKAGEDHIERLAHEGDPVRALIELVWNAIDAEATTARVVLERDDSNWDGITAVRVIDDGHGIDRDELANAFSTIGDSWKRLATRSKNGKRVLHGSEGQGRLRALALGSHVVWDSVSVDTAGQQWRLTVEGTRANRKRFRPTAEEVSGQSTGTTVVASNQEQRGMKALEDGTARAGLLAAFAPVLLNTADLVIEYDGDVLDPKLEILDDTHLEVPYVSNGKDHTVTLRVIEWKPEVKTRSVHAGIEHERYVFDQEKSPWEAKFPFSAYLTFPGQQDRVGLLSLGDAAPEPIGEGWAAAEKAVREHFASRRLKRRREQVQEWKDQGIHPYPNTDPATEAERAERVVFDVVAGTLAPYVPSSNKPSAKLMLRLIKDHMQHDPVKFGVVLKEVSGLKPDELDSLARLLGETSLSAIIRSANAVATRNKFLLALNHMLFDPDDSPTVKERDHLHRILEGELWVFGEGYNMVKSEQGLTNVLRTHLKLSGLPDKDVLPVKKWDGKSGRVDLHLAVTAREHDRVRHLIVELKAPDVPIGREQLDQVEDYMNAILKDPQFAVNAGQWDIVLLGTKIDDVARNRITQENRASGQLWEQGEEDGPHVRVFLRQWSEVIEENKRRLEFLRSLLEHDPSAPQSLSWLRETYPDFVPDGLGAADSDTNPESAASKPPA